MLPLRRRLLAGKAARWSLSWGRNPALSSVVALVNTTDIFSKVCTGKLGGDCLLSRAN